MLWSSWDLNMWCLRYRQDTHGPETSCKLFLWDLHYLPLTQSICCQFPREAALWAGEPPRQGDLYSGLYHCGRVMCILKTVIDYSILSLYSADCKCEICPWPTASEPVWDPSVTVGNLIDQSLWRLAWFMLKPVQIGFSITMQEALTWLAGDGGRLSRDDTQGEWSLGQHYIPTGS